MNELSLFSGAGGGLLGTHLLGWTPIGYVEYDDYCQRIIAARIEDGFLDQAPIFGDIRAFISEGYADAYSGLVDIVSAGFPCQPFSVAGQRKGADDDRNLWPETIDVIRRVRPQFAYLENVPGLLVHPYARRIYGDLAESGYDCIWRWLSAAETGAPHRRDRWWCVAYTSGTRLSGSTCGQFRRFYGKAGSFQGGQSSGRITASGHPWSVEPDVGRVAHGVASRVDRLRALGNGQVPTVVQAAWELLTIDKKDQ